MIFSTPFSKARSKAGAVILLCVPLGLASCERKQAIDESPSGKTLIVATTTQLADLARQIGGDGVRVEALMGPGVDPHSYRATARDLARLHQADLILFHGLFLEGKMAQILEETNGSGKATFSPCHQLPTDTLLRAEGQDSEAVDPHLWFDPDLWILCAQALAERLAEENPLRNEVFRSNFAAFESSVREIQKWGKQLMREVPKEFRILITSHDAFRYFGRSFGIKVIGLQGINTVVEAGLGDRATLADFIRRHQSPALFVESSVNPKAMREIARETGVVIGGSLFSDALGSTDQTAIGPNGNSLSAATWQGMMAHNLTVVHRALIKGP